MHPDAMTDAIRRYEEERLRDRPDDRALHALGRPYSGCSMHSPCSEHLLDGARAIPYGKTTYEPVEADELLLPS